VTEIRAEERVARRVANFPGRLRCEGCDVKELGIRLVSTRVDLAIMSLPPNGYEAEIQHMAFRH
jgi:hypothetical protein